MSLLGILFSGDRPSMQVKGDRISTKFCHHEGREGTEESRSIIRNACG
ncbi:MAG: hypothetical protein WBL95_15650 [Microcoleus sp.]